MTMHPTPLVSAATGRQLHPKRHAGRAQNLWSRLRICLCLLPWMVGAAFAQTVVTPAIFQNTPVGSTSNPQTLSVLITSAGTISSISIPSSYGGKQEFSLEAITGCATDGVTSNPAGTVCTVSIRFSPIYPGLRNAGVFFAGSAGKFSVGLHAVGTGPLAVITPGTVSTFAGNGTIGYSGDNGPATSAMLSCAYPKVDFAGNVYIGDCNNHVVRRVDATTGMITAFAGNGISGNSGDGGPATSARLGDPQAMAFDSAGNVYIVDAASFVVRKVTIATGTITTVAGNGTKGTTGTGGQATQAEINPYFIAIDSNGNLLITEGERNVIRMVSASTGVISVVAGTGAAGHSGDGGMAVAAQINYPWGIALDAQDNIYFSEYQGYTIRRIAANSGVITTVAGQSGMYGYTGDGGPATSATLGPLAVMADSVGDVYFTNRSHVDNFHDVIRKVSSATGIISTIAGGGMNSPTAGGPATGSSFGNLNGIAIDAAGNLYLGDYQHAGVFKVDTSAALVYPTSTPVGSLDAADDPLSVTLNNIGNDALIVAPSSGTVDPVLSSSWLLDAASSCSQITAAAPTSYSVAAGSECLLAVDFKPVSPGLNSGTLAITDNSLNVPTSQQVVPLTGTATAPYGLSIAPSSIAFPPTAVGTTSAVATATLTLNGGSSKVNLTPGALTDATNFSQSDNCGGSITPNGTCTVTFTFAPKSAGTLSSTYSIALQSGGAPVTVALSGTGSGVPQAVLTPGSASFGSVVVPASSAQTFTLSNPGSAALPITSIGISGTNASSFTQTNGCGSSLAAGTSCTIVVTFTPITSGNQSATLSVFDSLGTQTSLLSGSATVGAVTIAPPMQTFSATTVGTASPSLQSVISNSTGQATSLSAGSLTDAADFTQSDNCNGAVAAGGSCTVTFTFTPKSVGALQATYAIHTLGTTSTVLNVALTGIATSAPVPAANLTPTSFTFATTAIGATSSATTFTLSNTGNASLPIASIKLTGSGASAFSIPVNGCGSTLAAGASCTVQVVFSPSATGSATASLTITDSVGAQSSTLAGVGYTPMLPDFTLTASPAAQSAYRGVSVTYTLQLQSADSTNPLTSSVSLVASGLPAGATASFQPASVVPGASGQNTTLTVTTPPLLGSLQRSEPYRGEGHSLPSAAAALGLLCLAGLRKRRSLPMLLALLLSLGSLTLAGCGTGTGFATPSTTSTITITATSGSLTHTATVTLTVR